MALELFLPALNKNFSEPPHRRVHQKYFSRLQLQSLFYADIKNYVWHYILLILIYIYINRVYQVYFHCLQTFILNLISCRYQRLQITINTVVKYITVLGMIFSSIFCFRYYKGIYKNLDSDIFEHYFKLGLSYWSCLQNSRNERKWKNIWPYCLKLF